ncbi:trimethylamine methyltransferase family protein, partial [bacterium]|nr:trimethylamine methyltransferase family protein [bacterium]
MIPRLIACSESEMDEIHEATLKILETTGVRFTEASAKKVFRDAGFPVDDNNVVLFPPREVEKAIESVPVQFTREGLDPDCKVIYGTGGCHFGVGSLPIYVYDIDTGIRRPATRSDMKNFSFMGSELENFDISNACVQGMDVPEEIIHVVWLIDQFSTSRKPFCSWYAKDHRTA